MRDSEILAMLQNDCPMCGPADCACTATEQEQYREIQRLRLTDEEREAIVEGLLAIERQLEGPLRGDLGGYARDQRKAAATLRALLDRTTL
jgi:hypothetical protein